MSDTTTPSVHIQAMGTAYSRPLRYSTLTRIYDSRWIGRRDADQQLAHTPAEGEQPSASLRAISAKHRERCERERMSAVLIAAPLIDRCATLVRRRNGLLAQVDEWITQIDQHSAPGTGEAAPVHKTEAHLDPTQQAARRERESAARIAPLARKRDAARHELADIPMELADIEGRLTTLFESLQARVGTLTFHYERRAQTIARGYLRRTPGDAEHPLNTRDALRPPAWASEPNPWLHASASDNEAEK